MKQETRTGLAAVMLGMAGVLLSSCASLPKDAWQGDCLSGVSRVTPRATGASVTPTQTLHHYVVTTVCFDDAHGAAPVSSIRLRHEDEDSKPVFEPATLSAQGLADRGYDINRLRLYDFHRRIPYKFTRKEGSESMVNPGLQRLLDIVLHQEENGVKDYALARVELKGGEPINIFLKKGDGQWGSAVFEEMAKIGVVLFRESYTYDGQTGDYSKLSEDKIREWLQELENLRAAKRAALDRRVSDLLTTVGF